MFEIKNEEGAGPEGLRNAGNKARQTYKEHGIKQKRGKKTQIKMDFFFHLNLHFPSHGSS